MAMTRPSAPRLFPLLGRLSGADRAQSEGRRLSTAHSVNLAEGEQKDGDYRALNPQGFVPMLEIDGHRLTQSLAIVVYLDQKFPEPPLMPAIPPTAPMSARWR